jgi:hypothetical protein
MLGHFIVIFFIFMVLFRNRYVMFFMGFFGWSVIGLVQVSYVISDVNRMYGEVGEIMVSFRDWIIYNFKYYLLLVNYLLLLIY